MTIIRIEAEELSKEEAENIMEYCLLNLGWSCVVDNIKIGTEVFYDLSDEKWQKYLNTIRQAKLRRKENDEHNPRTY